MSNVITLLGGEIVAGSAEDNTQTDTVEVAGSGNEFDSIGGNLTLTGSTSPYDTNTTVSLTGTEVTDNVSLNGGDNLVTGAGLDDALVTLAISGAGGTSGGNTVTIDNEGGTTGVTISGAGNSVSVNGNAANSITITNGGGDSVTVGGYDDDEFDQIVTLALSGGADNVYVGDENANVMITGTGGNTVTLGDGDSFVSTAGSSNVISVGGGNNVINAGGGHSTVYIDGADGEGDGPGVETTFTADSDDPLSQNATDVVEITGCGNLVEAGYENVTVIGSNTMNDDIDLGNGNNNVTLSGTGGNTVNLGNGVNGVNFVGASDSNNTVNITDPKGKGTDAISLGFGSNDTVNFDAAGGSVIGNGTGTTTINQDAGSRRALNINLNGGTGDISVGNGNDTITANGGGSQISAGDGNDNVTANGGGDTITLGNGRDTVNANGAGDSITLGNGNDNVTANGAGDVIILGNGNDTVTANGANDQIGLGSGNENVTAMGSGDLIYISGGSHSKSTINFGSNSTLDIAYGGTDLINGNAGDDVNADGLKNGSSINLTGNNDSVALEDSSVNVNLNHVNTGDALTIQADGNGANGGNYTGTVTISNFTTNDTIDLQGLDDAKGNVITSVSQLKADGDFYATALDWVIKLQGGGEVLFAEPTTFPTGFSNIEVTHNQGPVAPPTSPV